MIIVPSYSILLNTLASFMGCTVDSEKVLESMICYLNANQDSTFQNYIQKCSTSLQDCILAFRKNIIELDDLCAPLIKELVC